MTNNYELLKRQARRTNVDLIKSLERRCGGYILNASSSLYDLEVRAEDVFVKKQFDELRCEMPGTPRSTFLMVFSPDGTKVASTHGNHNIYVTDVRSGKNIKTLIGHPRTPWCIAFHPTSNQILASGCLGGHVRIWDLSGGSETWTSEIPTVIASIAFHPDDRLLVIATYNELYFWDWSKPEPFMHVATGSIKEKVRYVAFDKLGHKLITGISNSPQTRWERVRTAVPVPRQVDRSANPYRRRITPRLISSIPSISNSSENVQSTSTSAAREPLTTVPERERRITACYRNLVREYELLVHRYLQIYRPPTMIDQGTDPMEIDLNSIAGSSNSSESTNPGNSQSRTSSSTSTESVFPASTYHSFNSLVNDANHRVSSASTNPLSGILFDTASRMNSSQRSSLSRSCTSVDDNYSATLGSSSNTIELSACPETSNRLVNITTSQNNTTRINSVQPSSQILNSTISNLQNNTLASNLQEVRFSPHIVRNISSEKNENLTKNISGQNDGKNSVPNLPNCSYTFRKLHQQNNSTDLQLSDNVSNTSTNIYERILPDSAIQEEPSHSLDGSILLDSTSLNTNRTQINKEQFDSKIVDLPTSSSKRSSLTGQSTTTKLKIQHTTSLKNFTNLNSERACEVLRGTKHVLHNINSISDTMHQTNLQDRERSVEYVEGNKNMSKHMVQDATPKETRLRNQNTLQDSNVNLFDMEPRPSTSGFRATPLESYDNSNSGINSKLYLPKQDNTKFYEHTRKRDYPSLLKKNRRPFIDSSSDSSSEEELASKRLRTAKLCSLSSRMPNANTSTSDIINNSGPSSSNNNNNTAPTGRPLNFNHELEVLVTDLLMNNEHTQNPTSSNAFNASKNGLKTNVEKGARQTSGESSTLLSTNDAQCSNATGTGKSECPKSTENSGSRTPSSAIYTQPGNHRLNRSGRFFSHRVSAFYPTRIQNLRPFSRLRRSNGYLSPTVRNRLRILNTLENPSRLGTFALDEVINYSERVATEDIPESDIGFHPFDPPPEVAAINPENIGIGNMYSNIVQELESSLNDVRNIRASSRLGETSDMLSSFSERLESIMNQSNTILRNLRTSIDILQPNHQNVTASSSSIDSTQSSSTRTNQPRILFSDSSFYLREQTNNQTSDDRFGRPTTGLLERSTSQDELYTNHNGNSSVAFDHTYPLNSRNSDSTVSNMSPLMVSLHLTVSHIQRQARLLRQQVESIERIDRAMLEVAQLQIMRQMFIEMQCYFRAIQCNENRSSLTRVRQMMAGTRISDSSPYDSPNDDSNENSSVSREEGISNSDSNLNLPQNSTVTRGQTRKTYPRCMFLMQRYFRRGSAGNIFQRRCLSRERVMRRHSFRRSYSYRSLTSRMPVESTRHLGNVNQLSSDTLRSITRRLESYLMEHGRHIGRVLEHTRNSTSTDKDEYIMMLRLNQCRNRILGQDFYSNSNIRRQTNSVTVDGSTRYNARDMLTTAIENLSRHIMNGTNITPSLRASIWNVIDLSLLLSEILLLQIVDSIPPPSGMNLDSERESLSARIDQMCSRMLQNRLSGQSQQLTRSLRLTRLAVRHASRALNQTYTARRNSMLQTSHNRDQRRMLLEEINNCLRNIRRHGVVTQMSNQRAGANIENLSRTEWFRTIHSLITRYRCSTLLENSQTNTNNNNANTDNAAQTEALQGVENSRNYSLASSDDDNESWYNNNQTNNTISDEINDRTRPLYRTNNVNLFNLLNTEEQSSSRSRSWNVPVVQINDIPISQYESQWHSRLLAGRQRTPERYSDLRTVPVGSFYRPRFLHPLHASNPFEADFDESVRENALYDSDVMTPITPNHRIQVWEFSSGIIPNINNALKNVVVNECKIHNDASVDIANNGNILVTLLPSGGYLNGTNRLGVYSLKWETLGQCLYVTNFEQNAVSVSLSPMSRHLVVGLASRRVSVMPSEKWTMARIFVLDDISSTSNQLFPIREVEQTRDPNYMSVNCIRWLPVSGQGLVYATNTGQLRILT